MGTIVCTYQDVGTTAATGGRPALASGEGQSRSLTRRGDVEPKLAAVKYDPEHFPGHPARCVAAFVDMIDLRGRGELGFELSAERIGAPACDWRLLSCVWLYGFMTGCRSSRKLEAACRDQVPHLWLTGWQVPDHNTLWRVGVTVCPR